MNLNIRQEQATDYRQTEAVIEAAFANAEISDQTEHELVRRIRATDAFIPALSLVAEIEKEIIGHILFSKVTIGEDEVAALALAPIAVLPAWQKQGVGKALMNTGIKHACELGYLSIIVLGHPAYYRQFGFTPAVDFNITPPFPVPDEVFMVRELTNNALANTRGEVKYSQAFME